MHFNFERFSSKLLHLSNFSKNGGNARVDDMESDLYFMQLPSLLVRKLVRKINWTLRAIMFRFKVSKFKNASPKTPKREVSKEASCFLVMQLLDVYLVFYLLRKVKPLLPTLLFNCLLHFCIVTFPRLECIVNIDH